jgi:hypothetical protein
MRFKQTRLVRSIVGCQLPASQQRIGECQWLPGLRIHNQQLFLDPKRPHAYIVRQTGENVPDMTKRELADDALKFLV